MNQTHISDWDVSRILLLGDSHGDEHFMEYAIAAAARNGCQALVQLGDFGYWEHTLGGRNYLDRVERTAKQCQIPVLFIDGNHENHEMLQERYSNQEVDTDGLCWVRDHVAWVTRGARWTWSGRSFAAAGGAASVDRSMRVQGWTWWPEEVLVRADIESLCDGQIDVLLCHDAPSIANMIGKNTFPEEDLIRCAQSRGVLDYLVRMTRPSVIFHGHWHVRHSTVAAGCRIEGLAHEAGPFNKAAVIFEVPGLEVLDLDATGSLVTDVDQMD